VPLLAAIAVAGGGIALGSVGGENAPDSGVRGVVLPRFPCPVILESDRCNEQARSASIVIRRATDRRRVAALRTDSRGRFRKALDPGTYLFQVTRAGQDASARTSAKRVVVPPHRFVPLILR
jgi:hypothetical protein